MSLWSALCPCRAWLRSGGISIFSTSRPVRVGAATGCYERAWEVIEKHPKSFWLFKLRWASLCPWCEIETVAPVWAIISPQGEVLQATAFQYTWPIKPILILAVEFCASTWSLIFEPPYGIGQIEMDYIFDAVKREVVNRAYMQCLCQRLQV